MDWEAIEMVVLTILSVACLGVDIYRSYRNLPKDDEGIPEHIKPPSEGDWPY